MHGGLTEYLHAEVGINSRLDALQAAVLRIKLPHLDAWAEARREKAHRYYELFAEAEFPAEVITPLSRADSRHVFHLYVLRVPRHREALMAHLSQCGIGNKVYYPVPLHLQECFRYLGYQEGDFPESERAALETLAVPGYPELTDEEQKYVVDCFSSFSA